jgi:hypothetical protein
MLRLLRLLFEVEHLSLNPINSVAFFKHRHINGMHDACGSFAAWRTT